MNKVYLIGAGPGDPELLTVKAVRVLQQAEVVLHDALVSSAILAVLPSTANVIDIGKRRGHKLLTQDEINALLVHYGQRAKITVRLKGGDPTIFGRAGEEIHALREAGIAYEIVPGITSAIAAATTAGISLTDRRFASSLIITTGHRGPGKEGLEWDRLVTSNSTVVIYMPGTDYALLSRQLQEAGLSSTTPCAVVSHAQLPTQNVLWTNLEHLKRQTALPAPAIVIVGECAAALPELASATDWESLEKEARAAQAASNSEGN